MAVVVAAAVGSLPTGLVVAVVGLAVAPIVPAAAAEALPTVAAVGSLPIGLVEAARSTVVVVVVGVGPTGPVADIHPIAAAAVPIASLISIDQKFKKKERCGYF